MPPSSMARDLSSADYPHLAMWAKLYRRLRRLNSVQGFRMIRNPKSPVQNRNGGGVWESNPPGYALAHPQTVLKTAPVTGRVSPPEKSSRLGVNAPKAG